jgi:hypothetical protein
MWGGVTCLDRFYQSLLYQDYLHLDFFYRQSVALIGFFVRVQDRLIHQLG